MVRSKVMFDFGDNDVCANSTSVSLCLTPEKPYVSFFTPKITEVFHRLDSLLGKCNAIFLTLVPNDLADEVEHVLQGGSGAAESLCRSREHVAIVSVYHDPPELVVRSDGDNGIFVVGVSEAKILCVTESEAVFGCADALSRRSPTDDLCTKVHHCGLRGWHLERTRMWHLLGLRMRRFW